MDLGILRVFSNTKDSVVLCVLECTPQLNV